MTHTFRRWYWTTCLTPTNPPMAMTGWWSRCTCCPPDRAMYHIDALATEQGRRWWERWFPVRFGASAVRQKRLNLFWLAWCMFNDTADASPAHYDSARSAEPKPAVRDVT